jgi:hypothetical protein
MTLDNTNPTEQQQPPVPAEAPPKPQYEPPQIIVYDESALADIVGPAVACARWNPI